MIRPIALSLLLACGGAAFAQEIPDRPEKLTFPAIEFKVPKAKDAKVVLKNRVPAYLVADPSGVPLVRVTVMWRGGAYLDPEGKAGLATLFGSQLVQGGTKSLDAAKLEDRLDALAATLASSTGDMHGSISLLVQAQDLKEGMSLLMKALTEPAFDKDRLDLARRSARQGIERRNDAVTSIAQTQLPRLTYGEGFFLAPHVTAASLDAIAREDLAAFHERLVHPANLVVAASGKFDRKQMTDLLNATLGSIKAGPNAEVSPKVPVPDFARKPGLYVVDKTAPQTTVQWVLPGLRRTDPDWHAAVVMNHILGGGGFVARLMKRIRSDEGLTYGVRTALSEGPYWRGDMTGGLQTKNRSTAFAMRIAIEEMQRLKSEPLSDEELKSIKDGLIESFPSQWAGRHATAERFANELLYGWPEDWWVDYRAKIQAVTVADVQRVAKKVLDLDQMIVLAVGKASEIEAGDPDHPGAFAEITKLPLARLPLRDPLT
ncbi:MAG: pitrilysin family protein, partial [Thermoanaerobaculia bacterium]